MIKTKNPESCTKYYQLIQIMVFIAKIYKERWNEQKSLKNVKLYGVADF